MRETLGFLRPVRAASMALGTGMTWPLISRTMGTSDAGMAPPRRTMGEGAAPVGAMGLAGVGGASGIS